MSEPKTILVTGASRGIGLLAAKALAERGHHVYASMRDMLGRNQSIVAELRGWAEEKGLALEPIELDVTDEASTERAVRLIEEQRAIDVLVNNAGIMPTGLTEAYTLAQAKDYFDVNMFGIMRTSRAVLPLMRARKSGLIINLSSSAGRLAIPFFGIYCASKWAMEAYCESLHYELEPFGIESVLIEPSGHSTDLVTTAPAPQDRSRVDAYGELAEGRERMLGMFKDMFELGEAMTDAGNVARKIVDLVEAKGPRPIRTQVGHDMGVSAVNEAVEPIQAQLTQGLKSVYMGEMPGGA